MLCSVKKPVNNLRPCATLIKLSTVCFKISMLFRAKEEAKRNQELLETKEKERMEIQRQEVESIKEVCHIICCIHQVPSILNDQFEQHSSMVFYKYKVKIIFSIKVYYILHQ
jgi:hypothetical protein